MSQFRPVVLAGVLILMAALPLTALEPIWSGVSPGEVSGAVATVGLNLTGTLPENLLALSTEDRHTRLYRADGEMVRAVRTGFRNTSAVVQERGGTILVTGDRGAVARVDPVSGRVQHLAALRGDLDDIWPDAAGNLFVLTGSREILHLSAAGRVLWQRRLPALVRSAVAAAGTIYLTTADGGLFRFDSTGRGEVVHRSTPVTQMFAAPQSDRDNLELLTVDEERYLHLLRVNTRDGNVRVSVVWSHQISEEARLLGADTGGRHWVMEGVGNVIRALEVRNGAGDVVGRFTVPGSVLKDAVLNDRTGNVYAADEDGRLYVIDETARLERTIVLEEPPVALVLNAGTGHLLLRFPEWRYAVYGESRVSTPESVPLWAAPGRNTGYTGAIGALAATTFSGTSLQERRVLLGILEDRLRERSLYGQVDEFRGVLIQLMTEAYSAPVTVRGSPMNDFPGVRIHAIELLEQLLDLPAREALTQVVRHEPQEVVAARALQAIGAFPRDQFGALEVGMARFRSTPRDAARQVLATGLVTLLEQLAVSPQTVAAATELSASSISRDLRRRAVEAVRR